jgi:SAM-dependent methyltransferase
MPDIKTGVPEDWFVCPVTKERLSRDGARLCSSFDCFAPDPEYGFWNFTPTKLDELHSPEWKAWEQLQLNGMVSYEQDAEHNLGVGKRADFQQFAAFCRFRGAVLDVGVGPQRIPSHFEYGARPEVLFVGIDPLRGDQPRDFAFVQGLGEYLPFREDLFDQVLFVTSLDHFIDPRRPLDEARRVVKPGGDVCIWIGEKDKSAPKPTQSYGWYEKLVVPAGAEDRFHYRRFGRAELEAWFAEVGLVVRERDVIEVDQWRRNLFYRAGR